jgi:hypothetical protein
VASHCAKVASEVLVASRLCIQSRSEGFGGSASAHTNRTVDFWWIYLFVGVTHKLQISKSLDHPLIDPFSGDSACRVLT